MDKVSILLKMDATNFIKLSHSWDRSFLMDSFPADVSGFDGWVYIYVTVGLEYNKDGIFNLDRYLLRGSGSNGFEYVGSMHRAGSFPYTYRYDDSSRYGKEKENGTKRN